MRRIAFLTAVFLMIPAAALASDLEEVLQRGQEARYTAEQIITCSTPDGVKDAVVTIRQDGRELQAAAPVPSDIEITTGAGGWSLSHEGAVINSAELEASEEVPEPRYQLDDGTAASFLGRRATSFEMSDGDMLRARLIIDNELGALLKVTTYSDDGRVYCERRFIAFDPTPPNLVLPEPYSGNAVDAGTETTLPDEIAGFVRLDHYTEGDLRYSYYSDGFFSFAVFETKVRVDMGRVAETSVDGKTYQRVFTPGQVAFAWETRDGGMALIGDLPPDMHAEVLAALPGPGRPNWWNRLWRGLFG